MEWTIPHISISVPRLRVLHLDGCKSGRIRRRPTTMNVVEFTSREVVEIRNCILIHAREGKIGRAGLCVSFTEWRVCPVVIHRAGWSRGESRTTDPIRVAIADQTARVKTPL